MTTPHPPALHDLVTVLRAPAAALTGSDGQLRAGGADGYYGDDRRLLSRLEVEIVEAEVRPVGRSLTRSAQARFTAVVQPADADVTDADLMLDRHRALTHSGLAEHLRLRTFGDAPLRLRVLVRAESDLAPVHEIRTGERIRPVPPIAAGGEVRWDRDGTGVVLTAEPAPAECRVENGTAVLCFEADLPPAGSWSLSLRVCASPGTGPAGTSERAPRTVFGAPSESLPLPWAAPAQAPVDHRRARLLQRSLDDLRSMLLSDPLDPRDRFLAAGSPWYFTLFGRDSLWSARMLLPLGTAVSGGTLRTLARRQGRRDLPEAEEQPGKILHEARPEPLRLGSLTLPPLYYGTVDATALWVRLLHDAWRAGLPEAEVAELLPHLRKALRWITEAADTDGDGFLEYRATAPGSLANQGWKDSHDGVRWSDGRLAEAPLALCEVQGYAHAAAVQGADLLESFGAGGTEQLREWAARLRERFREAYWVCDDVGPYPAIALDGAKRPVDGASSNMAHLLGTGLLSPDEAATVARRLSAPDMDCGFGLRTLSSTSAAFNPMSYHCGSVWPHDTAIAVLGLAAEGHHEVARSLANGVVEAAERFEYRLPELYGGVSAADGAPLPAYPAACRPQAWAAAGAVAVVGYLESPAGTASPGGSPAQAGNAPGAPGSA
ncbi:glycogen debranching N-terminal domain-containing protein [Actinacidiphila sp. bgisy160]|uniref:glycogen debranching N-terminal domain-containing protein n=1 Tax=Actinacidiphila sp. bgisy160 TaxID=3413796 RepID=UPI003D70D3D1